MRRKPARVIAAMGGCLLAVAGLASTSAAETAIEAASGAQLARDAPRTAGPVVAHATGLDSVVLEFPDAMRTWDNLAEPVRIQGPGATPAQCTWDSDTRLRCRLEAALRGATPYRVKLAAGLTTQAGATLGAATLAIATPRPKVGVGVHWTDHGPRLQLAPNMPLREASLRSVLRVEREGRPVAFTLERLPPRWRGDASVRYGIELSPVVAAGRALLTVRVRPGLRSSEGPLRGEQDEVLLRLRPEVDFALRGVACDGPRARVRALAEGGLVEAGCQAEGGLSLVFSHPLDAGSRQRVAEALRKARGQGPQGQDDSGMQLRGWSGAEPFAGDGVRVPPEYHLALPQLPANETLELHLQGLRNEDGAELPPTIVRIRTGEARPQLRARHRQSLLAGGDRRSPMVEALNGGPVALEVQGLGARSRQERIAPSTPREGSVPTPLESPVARRTLAEGGWVRWVVPGGAADLARYRPAVEFSAPAFDLLAVAGRREVLAWANEWDGDAPVPGASIELLWRQDADAEPRVAARAVTGPDGVALLRLPDDLRVEAPPGADPEQWTGPAWQLRAVAGDGAASLRAATARAVLPLGESSPLDLALGRAAPRHFWGVSDRPLYRAGETVRYHLWQREIDGMQARTPASVSPVTLRLHDEKNASTVLEWSATPAADGSLHGTLALPVHLTDGTYCIGVEVGYETEGSCFHVGTHRAQDLWAEAKTPGGVLRDGDRLGVELTGGYFSGGPAAGVEVERLDVLLVPFGLAEAYPRYAEFAFVDVEYDAEGEEFDWPDLGPGDVPPLDGEGRLRLDVPLAFDAGEGDGDGRKADPAADERSRPPFGRFEVDAEMRPRNREGTVAKDLSTHYARHDRYVGLKIAPEWFGARDPVSAEAIVITAEGAPVPDATVEVTVEYRPGFHRDAVPTVVGRCVLRTGVADRCDFPRERSGRYRMTARSGDAAPVHLERLVWVGDGGIAEGLEADLVVQDPSPGRDAPVRLLLTQPHARARALFVVASGGRVLGHRVEEVAGNASRIDLDVSPEWRHELDIHAFVRPAGTSRVSDDGYREPVAVESLQATVAPARLPPADVPVGLAIEADPARPGGRAVVILRNSGTAARDVVLAVMDDALRAQAQRWLPYADPALWLERLRRPGSGLAERGFHQWNDAPWRYLLPDPDRMAGPVSRGVPAPPAQIAESFENAPAAMNRYDGYSDDATALDRIEVTGSRIRLSDILESTAVKAPDAALRRPAAGRDGVQRPEAPAVRHEFADTALWQPGIRLAAGETRRIEFDLPDNLTRWRAVAWSAGEGEDLAMAEATLEVGLPVEARLQVPARIYPGDEAVLATSVRNATDAPAIADTRLQVRGPGYALDDARPLSLRARGEGAVVTGLAGRGTGVLDVVASARTPEGRDAVAMAIEVASPRIEARKVQAGWVGTNPVELALPRLPPGASDPRLQVTLVRGGAGLVQQWSDELHAYPHRCWEQILSRAVAAALALERNDPAWPDAAQAVDEALRNAAVFQRADGSFRFFADSDRHGLGAADSAVVLTAYTLRAFAVLRELGHAVPHRPAEAAEQFLDAALQATGVTVAGASREPESTATLSLQAFAAASRVPEDAAVLERIWQRWEAMPLPAQVALAQALAKASHPKATEAVARLLARAPLRGGARRLASQARHDAWMSSDLREQCTLLDLLRDHPALASPEARGELLAGLQDLYAGGVARVDTQAAATCLVALREPGGDAMPAATAVIDAGRSGERTLELPRGGASVDWNVGPPMDGRLRVRAGTGPGPLGFVARLDYAEDARVAQASAVGFSLDRRYAVFRDGEWKALDKHAVREGDWVRITLVVRNSAERRFVAITDAVPGGLQPTDLSLSGVAAGELLRLANEGAYDFRTRRLDPRAPRFYAETLSPGIHEVHYFARAGNSGDYLAAPATAELMYGTASQARTAATRLRIAPARGR